MKYMTLIVALIGFTGCNAPMSTPTSDQSNASSGLTLSASTGSSSQSSNGSSGSITYPDPTHFLYFACKGDNDIYEFGVHTSDGTLAPIPGNETIATHSQPVALIMHPNKKFLYAINSNDTYIDIYSIDPSDGHLTALTPASAEPFGAMGGFDSTGTHFYVQNMTGGSVIDKIEYIVNTSTGALTYYNTVFIIPVSIYTGIIPQFTQQFEYTWSGDNVVLEIWNSLTSSFDMTSTTYPIGNTPSAANGF